VNSWDSEGRYETRLRLGTVHVYQLEMTKSTERTRILKAVSSPLDSVITKKIFNAYEMKSAKKLARLQAK